MLYNKTGTTVLELAIYILLLTIVAGLLGTVGSYYVRSARQLRDRCSGLIVIQSAFDALSRDIKNSSASVSYMQTQPTGLIMRAINSSSYDIGWLVENERLVRIEGRYQGTTNSWHDSTKSLVLEGVKKYLVTMTVSEQAVKTIEVVINTIMGKELVEQSRTIYSRTIHEI